MTLILRNTCAVREIQNFTILKKISCRWKQFGRFVLENRKDTYTSALEKVRSLISVLDKEKERHEKELQRVLLSSNEDTKKKIARATQSTRMWILLTNQKKFLQEPNTNIFIFIVKKSQYLSLFRLRTLTGKPATWNCYPLFKLHPCSLSFHNVCKIFRNYSNDDVSSLTQY